MDSYQNIAASPAAQEPQHIVSAREMASHMVANFTPIEQNEMFRVLQSVLYAERIKQIEKTASQLDFLKLSLEDLRIS